MWVNEPSIVGHHLKVCIRIADSRNGGRGKQEVKLDGNVRKVGCKLELLHGIDSLKELVVKNQPLLGCGNL